jgi:hypothetical protein
MNLTNTKFELISWLITLEDKDKIKKLVDIKENKKVELKSNLRNTLTKSKYTSLILEADKRITKGEFILVDDLEKEIENWK